MTFARCVRGRARRGAPRALPGRRAPLPYFIFCSRPTSSERDSCSTSTPGRARTWSASHTGDRLGLAFRLHRGRFGELDRVARRPVRRLVDEHAVDRRGALQAGCRVDDVARGHAFAGARLRVEPHERLTRRDPHAKLELVLERELPDRERGAHGSLGVVLVRDGSAEQRHHRVADELLDGAAVVLELGAKALVVGPSSASTSSGSIDSACDVKPTRSQNRTVTTLRSLRDTAKEYDVGAR